ncbi:MAG: toprim domain-containing protein [Acidaminococcus intestini]|uniref:Toprim domain-containing protein n=1 Tax=Acidaminococcus intestini TaxID=187327 RepID=A0A943I482_9FIRM|nr:toprim domain-containing protein [Acidaminococcus intestini]
MSTDDDGEPIQVANYMKDGKVLWQKTRDRDKNFCVRGKSKPMFWGQHLFSGGRKLIITEGEIDCLTVSQVQGNKYPVVSVPNGCKSARETIKSQMDWLMNFEEVILMLDMDEAGRQAVQQAAGILPPHKLKIATLPLKDPNECLLAGKADDIIHAIWNAPEYRPDGILNAKDLKDTFFKDEESIKSYAFPWDQQLTKMTQGIRKGEMLLLTAGTGIGKSTMAREIAYKLKVKDGLKVGMVMLEENKNKTLRDLLSIDMHKPLHLLWNTVDKQEVGKAYDRLYGDGNFCLYDHFGSIEGDNLLEKIRYLIVGEECDFVIFDHVSIAISGLDEASMNERKAIDVLMTQLRSLVEETGAGIVVVSHLRKVDTKATPFEQGGTISLDDLRGSGSLKQIPDTILALERDQQADEEDVKNLMKLRVLKCRFTGNTGLAGYIRFDKSKNILEDVDPLEIKNEKESDDSCPF